SGACTPGAVAARFEFSCQTCSPMAITNSAAKSPSATFPSHAFVTSSSPETTSEFAVQRVQSDLQCAAHPDMRCHPPRQRRPHRIVRAHHHPTRTPWQQVGVAEAAEGFKLGRVL